MKQTLKLGKVAGIAIGANWSVLAILGLIVAALAESVLPRAAPGASSAAYWAVALPVATLFFASLLAHELSHALVARHHGVSVQSVTLWALGGVTETSGSPPNPRADLHIASAGPLASLATALVFSAVGMGAAAIGAPALATAGPMWLVIMNVALAVFNLLPGAPLDGGRILRALLWKRYGDRDRAEHAATKAGGWLGYGLIALGIAQLLIAGWLGGLWLTFLGWFIASAAANEDIATSVKSAAQDLRVDDLMTPQPAYGAVWQPIRSFVAEAVVLSRQSVFPVVDLMGTPHGVVTVNMLARISPERSLHPLGEIMLPLPPGHVDAPDDPAAPLLTRMPVGSELISVVVADGRVVGMVTTEDLQRLVQREGLRKTVTEGV
ncbi:site-2 protease family protein [Spirillospora sp. NPDC048911]|uniref:site-2 protease family protein n=1 Tax=Spirillospora sp. NPDC048911 TaxID=3364527 RepID=UPI00371631F7